MIELLESRIAPAAVVTFYELDGDKVTVKTTKGTQAQLETALGIDNGDFGVEEIALDFVQTSSLAAAFAKTNITITTRRMDGDGLANSVSIDAYDTERGIDLGTISIKGDLEYIDAGDDDYSTLSIKKLTTTNFSADEEFGGIISEINGHIGSIVVTKNFDGYISSVNPVLSEDATHIASFTVNGNFALASAENAGFLQVGSIGKLLIKGTFYGPGVTASDNNGVIEATSIDKMSINRMSLGATIRLVQDLEIA